jgi:crotonobetainyl-CoA:carnitine CoA-transferase CaiB-like acyl-CoA transferase
MTKALEGIRILEWVQWLNGSVYQLGDLGAEVIHIEDTIRGDASRGLAAMWGASTVLPGGRNMVFDTSNRSKKGITLDLKNEKGKEVLYRLVKNSDVFVTNSRKSVALRLGMDYQTLCQHNPQLIYVNAAGLGERGPFSEIRAFDPLTQAMSGMMWCMGDRDDPEPVQISGAVFDSLGASVTSYAVVVGLLVRERLGIGQEIDTSQMRSALTCLLAGQVRRTLWLGRPIARHSRKRERNALANHYRCADGKWLMLSEAQSDRFWHEICETLGMEELENEERFSTALKRRESYAELIPILEEIFARKTRDEWIGLFQQKGCQFSYAPILTFEEMVNHPQVVENEYLVETDHPTLGRVRLEGSPFKLSKTPATFEIQAPEFGQHTEEVLIEAGGYTWEEIAQLREDKVI